MRKYLSRYLFFWLPAALIIFFFNNSSMLSQVCQWFFAFFMVLGWSVNTGMMAYQYPRRSLSVLLLYLGISILAIVYLYTSTFSGPYAPLITRLLGLFSYTPLERFVYALLDFSIPHELYVTGFLVACCVVGYLLGLLYRWLRPNPYRPRFTRG